LVREGSLLLARDNDGRSILHMAVEIGDANMTRYLLELGVPVLIYDRLNRTPLHLATVFGSDKMVKLLLSWGADTSVVDNLGRSCADWAKSLKREGVMTLFGVEF
jgi:ankyrin repeat protein